MRSRPGAERPRRVALRRLGRLIRQRLPRLIPGLLLAASACGEAEREDTLVVHSTLPPRLLGYVEEAFEAEHPGVDVRIVVSSADGTLAALGIGDAAVDVWWGAPVTVLATAAAEGLLQPYRPAWVGTADMGEPDQEDRWQVSLVSPFVIAFNREAVTLSRAPRDWGDLFHFRWAGEVAIADPARSPDAAHFAAAMLVEALRTDDDLVGGFDWLRRLDAAVAEYAADHGQVIRRLADGQDLLGILPRHVVEEARHDEAPWIHYRLPESGTPMLARGIAIAADAPEPELARRFVDMTGTVDIATVARLETRWRPVQSELDVSRFPPDFEIDMPWTPYPLATDTIATQADGWMERWSREVRGVGSP